MNVIIGDSAGETLDSDNSKGNTLIGFESAFKTFGVMNYTYKSIIGMIALIFWAVIPIGFIVIVLYLGFNF